MGYFRFRRSIRFGPWFRVNVSKTGVSESIGRRPFTINLRGNRARETVSLPGTGISYTTQSTSRPARGSGLRFLALLVVLVVLVLVATRVLA